jgi:tetratricopeptide (TPR) repeat protein
MEDVSIRVQVIRAKHEDHVWGDEFDGKWEDIFSIQDEIALKVANRLKTVLSPEEIRKIEKNPTENLEAYNLYLKGRYSWNKRTADGFIRGIDFFHQAIDEDSAFSLAYAGIADCYNLLGWHDIFPSEVVYPKAKAAAEKALGIDETLSQAHASLAYVTMLYDWNWRTAEKEFIRALELNPNYAEAHQWYSEYLAYMGKHDESIKEAIRALELDPLSLSINHNLGLVFYEARQFDLAIDTYQKTLQIDPSFIITYNYLGLAYSGEKMYNNAIANVQKAIELSEKQSPLYIGTLGFIYASMGKTDEAKEILELLLELSQHRYIAPVSLAIIYGALGQMDQAFEWMEKGYEVRDDYLMTLQVAPRLDSLRSDPRFQDLANRMNFPKN